MHVTVSTTFPAALRPVVESLVRAGFAGVEAGDVEVHVKARGNTRRSYVVRFRDGSGLRCARKRDALEIALAHEHDAVGVERWVRAHPRAGGWSARTYGGVPDIARVEPGTAYLVTMNIPADPRRLTRYPLDHRYPGLKTAPVVRFGSWQEQLVHLSAHEARHVHQFRHDLRRSEIDAERWAGRLLDTWRRAGGPPGA